MVGYISNHAQVVSDKNIGQVIFRLDVLQQKIAKLQQLLTGAKKQPDDPAEVPRLEKELAAAHAELAALKKA